MLLGFVIKRQCPVGILTEIETPLIFFIVYSKKLGKFFPPYKPCKNFYFHPYIVTNFFSTMYSKCFFFILLFFYLFIYFFLFIYLFFVPG